MIRKIYRTLKKSIWIFIIFLLYFIFGILTTYPNEVKVPAIKKPPLKYKIIKNDFNISSLFSNLSIKGKSIIETKYPISTYYRLLNDYTGVCRKLARFGGTAQCRKPNQTEFYLDGQKILCVEPEMRVFTSKKREDCLVLSFGTLTEVSFDFGARDANCQVHLFDVIDYEPLLQLNDTLLTFHQFGLSDENVATFYYEKNLTVYFNTFDYILYKLNATSKLINVLKMDIEGMEWKSLDYMLKKSLLAQVGQIAIEVHDMHENDKFLESSYRKKLRILLELEEAGFRRIQYHDNEICTTVIDELGIKHCHAGELLLVNMNWYDNDYMRNLEESLKHPKKVKYIEEF